MKKDKMPVSNNVIDARRRAGVSKPYYGWNFNDTHENMTIDGFTKNKTVPPMKRNIEEDQEAWNREKILQRRLWRRGQQAGS